MIKTSGFRLQQVVNIQVPGKTVSIWFQPREAVHYELSHLVFDIYDMFRELQGESSSTCCACVQLGDPQVKTTCHTSLFRLVSFFADIIQDMKSLWSMTGSLYFL